MSERKGNSAIWKAMGLVKEAKEARQAAVLNLNLCGIHSRQDLLRCDITLQEAIELAPLLPEDAP